MVARKGQVANAVDRTKLRSRNSVQLEEAKLSTVESKESES